MILDENWKFNVLNIYNFNDLNGPYAFIFRFLEENNNLDGDILESGTYQGRMALSMAYFLKSKKYSRKVHTFDTFSGFPSYSINDANDKFEELMASKSITKEHYEQILELREINLDVLNKGTSVDKISTSGDFATTSIDKLQRKIEYLKLDEIINIYVGPFELTMISNQDINKLVLVFLDSDLYDSYIQTLNYVKHKLVIGGIIFLDEYFSLKFPGPRYAVNDFILENPNFELKMLPIISREFERWIMIRKW